jgi:hypothetical protein
MSSRDEDFDFELESRSYHRPRLATSGVSNTIIVHSPSASAHSLGIASLVVGVLSFLLCWIPFVGIAVSSLGLFLGLVGLVVAIIRRGSGSGFSIAGSVLSALSLAMCLAWTAGLIGALQAVDSTLTKQSHTNQRAVPEANPSNSATRNPENATLPDAKQPPVPPAKSEPEWVDASRFAVQQGALQIRVARVVIGPVPLKTLTGDSISQDDLLMIKLELLNTNPTKKVDYQTWSGRDISLDRDFATLEDNFGNSYKRISFGLASYPVGAVERSESIYPNKVVTDVLVFEVPLQTIDYLRLELPATNFGGTGMLRFQIPKTMIQR